MLPPSNLPLSVTPCLLRTIGRHFRVIRGLLARVRELDERHTDRGARSSWEDQGEKTKLQLTGAIVFLDSFNSYPDRPQGASSVPHGRLTRRKLSHCPSSLNIPVGLESGRMQSGTIACWPPTLNVPCQRTPWNHGQASVL
ncbi:hypothetical protein PHLCEN_2v1271 [Hermanssonia centrifuga]|uniref:Uncharacterized protein n=1 Tax=Hermanssonia centrifuga TaxID=98765 RepID=A0A2R6S3K7_9APHY|nr:hypothetical protein PHLCEN_2v1271 [Hermanssonia centrifuga]